MDKQTGWAFFGFYGKAEPYTKVPIGVFSTYSLGAASANAWMKTATNPVRWEGERLYEEMLDGE